MPFWKNVLCVTPYISDIIEFGLKIPFLQTPTPIFCKNNLSARNHSEFVEKAIGELLEASCIKEFKTRPYCVNPLTVSMNSSGKGRLILDLRHVNNFVEKQKIKFEGCKQALSYAHKGNKMVKFDLKSGYFHLDVHENYYQYLGFSWTVNNITKFYVFTVLPFGLSIAGAVFTKVLRPLVKRWRSFGFQIILYLDDGWASHDEETCRIVSKTVQEDLNNAGFVVNNQKSIWEPTSRLEWLGFIWDLKKGSVEIPDKKFICLKEGLMSLIKGQETVSARNLARTVGRIISMSFALGNICQIMTRNLHVPIQNRVSWDKPVILDFPVMDELIFWLDNIDKLPFRTLSPIYRIPERIMFTDASNFAGAAVLLETEKKYSRCMFDEIEASESSTFRELKAVEFSLRSFSTILTGKFVKLYTDNQNVVRIINVGSTVSKLQQLAISIFQICISKNIAIDVAWVPRQFNCTADQISKVFDYDDWAVSNSIFTVFNNRWGPHTYDRFADDKNKQIEKFNSEFWCPGTTGVDAFAYDWSEDNNWLVPPIYLIPKVLKHMLYYRAKGTLVVPKWKSALFWPCLVDRTGNFHTYVVDSVEYVKPKNFFIGGSHKESIFAKSPFISNVLVLRINCSK